MCFLTGDSMVSEPQASRTTNGPGQYSSGPAVQLTGLRGARDEDSSAPGVSHARSEGDRPGKAAGLDPFPQRREAGVARHRVEELPSRGAQGVAREEEA